MHLFKYTSFTKNTLLHAKNMQAQTGPFCKEESATFLMGPFYSHKSSPSGIYTNSTLASQSALAPSLVPYRALLQDKAIHQNYAVSIINTKEITIVRNKEIKRKNITVTNNYRVKPNDKNSLTNNLKITSDKMSTILQLLRLEHLTFFEQEHMVTSVKLFS